MEYFTIGVKNLRVTQSYKGVISHLNHWYKSKNYADYPIDIAGVDEGKDPYYATVDMKVTKIFGVGKSYTNTIWLESVERVQTPSGVFKIFIALTHFNDNDVKDLKEGSIIKKGNIICYEGNDGASGNHLHLVVGNAERGSGNRLLLNSNRSWVSSGYCLKPEQVMYIDKEFTNVINVRDIKFIYKPIINYYKIPSIKTISIIDSLKNIKVDSSFINRTRIANKNGIFIYRGSEKQNKLLVDLLYKGKLIC